MKGDSNFSEAQLRGERNWLNSRARLAKLPEPLPPFQVQKDSVYPDGWNYALRKKIRQRDEHTCIVCSMVGKGLQLQIHHIDFNKANSKELNLVTLCRACHKRTNYHRAYWHRYLYDFMRYHHKTLICIT